MLKVLAKLANRLDSLGLTKEADVLDREIIRFASKKSKRSGPEDTELSVGNLEKIVALEPYDRWLYMTKDEGKNNDFIQGEHSGLSDRQKELLENITELCAEDFNRESEFAEIKAAEDAMAAEPTISNIELSDIIERMKEEGSGKDNIEIPDYRGRGVSVFRDPRAPLLRGDESKRYSIKVHKKPELRDRDIDIHDLPSDRTSGPGQKKEQKDMGMTPEEVKSFQKYLDDMLSPKEKIESSKSSHKFKVEKLKKLKNKIKELKESISGDINKEQKSEIESELSKALSKLNIMLSGSRVMREEESTEGVSKNFSDYTIKDIEPNSYYVFQLMLSSKKKMTWIAKGEFEDIGSAEEFKNSLETESGVLDTDSSIGSAIVVDGSEAKELISNGEARFTLEPFAGGKTPMLDRDRGGVSQRQIVDSESLDSVGAPNMKMSGF